MDPTENIRPDLESWTSDDGNSSTPRNRRRRLLLLYWGRRGGLSQFTLDVTAAARLSPTVEPFISVSTSGENFSQFAALNIPLLAVETFPSRFRALINSIMLPRLLRQVGAFIHDHCIEGVVTMMPHVWSPLLAGTVHAAGARYGVIVHDADPHPGDLTALVNGWLYRDTKNADIVFTLSQHVADRLVARNLVPADRLRLLFHPILNYETEVPGIHPANPFRFLFLGRILRYKGLDILIEAMEEIQRQGLSIALSVVGEGNLQNYRQRLEALDVSIDNRWVAHEEIGAILARHDAIILPYIEASQSGLVGAAMKAGLPILATPVGGIKEQVIAGETGLIATSVTPQAVADAMMQMATDPVLYRHLQEGVRLAAQRLSPQQFLDRLVHHLFRGESSLVAKSIS